MSDGGVEGTGIINRKNRGLLLLLLLLNLLAWATGLQLEADESIWQDVPRRQVALGAHSAALPLTYWSVRADIPKLNAFLEQAALEKSEGALLLLPLPDGEYSRFALTYSPILPAALSAKYPEIRTFAARGVDDSNMTARLGWTQHGFHAIIHSGDGTIYIDPISHHGGELYISYYERDVTVGRPYSEQPPIDLGYTTVSLRNQLASSSGSTRYRTYRIAVATTGEFTAHHGGTVADGLAAVVTAVNRVYAIFEKELGIRFVLVDQNDRLIYTDPATDPYFDSTTSQTTLEQNQDNLDRILGAGGYDIGHLFTSTNGGLAGIGTACTVYKAWGATGLSNPSGAPININILSHELGHQLGAQHSFNSNTYPCSYHRAEKSAYEPGSGSTLMSYAGLCSGDSLQPAHDAYFHANSISEMQTFVQAGFGSTCGVPSVGSNTQPVADAGKGGFVIPHSTPFELMGSASDADGDTLTYAWEQYDLGPAGGPDQPEENAPIFRSFLPTGSPKRTFPRLADLLANENTIGETLPTYSRTLTFRLTVRDNRGGVGYDTIQFGVSDKAGPFRVTTPNTAVSWRANESREVRWRVGKTRQAPVSCAHVNILLSTDGGYSFPVTLLNNTTNDGKATVTLPNVSTERARLKVACADSIFFDISNADFSIVSATGVQSPTAVSILGPTDGVTNTAYSFTASVLPLTTTLPITYSWSTNEHDVLINTGPELTHTASFEWATSGTKTVFVEVVNEGGAAVVQTHAIRIKDMTPPDPILNEWRIFIPIARQK